MARRRKALPPCRASKTDCGENVKVLYATGGTVGNAPDGRSKNEFGETVTNAADEKIKAVELARKADVAIVFVGTTAAIEQEGHDRKTLGLTGTQEELVEAVFAANPKTIVVEMSAGPLAVPWIKQHVPAMLQAWWPGEEGGHAIADVLFGDVNPAGRLPHTVYISEAQVPPVNEYDITQGFTYMYARGEPLFPFGHGLSYTTFKYGNLKLSANKIKASDMLKASVDITNVRQSRRRRSGAALCASRKSSVKRPAKELRGFQRIRLQPAETKTVIFTLPGEKLAFWDETTHGFIVEPGKFDMMVGASSTDIRQNKQIEIIR